MTFDNFGGIWGNPAELDKFLQAYAIEKTKIEARKRGHSVTEQPLSNGGSKTDDPSQWRCCLNRIIEVVVSPTGETKLETRGFSGSACREGSRFLEEARSGTCE